MKSWIFLFSLLILWGCHNSDMATASAPAPLSYPAAPAQEMKAFSMEFEEDEPENREGYAEIQENDFIATSEETTSTFAIDVDAASYSNVRRFINDGSLPPIASACVLARSMCSAAVSSRASAKKPRSHSSSKRL